MLRQMIQALDATTVLTFCIVLLVSYIIWNFFFTVRYNIPGPTPWPVIGNLAMFVGIKDFSKKTYELQETYGDLVLLWFGPQPVVLCFGYKNVHEALLVNGEKTKFRPNWLYIFEKLFPKMTGIFFSNGQVWSDGRKFSVVALKDFGVGKKTIDERINEEVEFLVELFSKNPGKPANVHEVFPMATSNIISNIIFGSRFDYDDPQYLEILSCIDFFFKSVRFATPVNFFPILGKLLPSNNLDKVFEKMQMVRKFVRTKIDLQRESFDPNNIRNFLDLYLEQEGKKDSKISEEFVFQVTCDLFNAGTDTTAMTLKWCMLYLLKYPDVQQKCREEVLKVVGDGRFPTSKDKEALPYVMATIREVLRSAAVAPIAVPHGVFDDIQIAGKSLPRKSIIICHIMSVLRDPVEWDEPDKFRPERFLDEHGKLFKPEAFCPFSYGPRQCIGNQLATNEVFLFLTSFLQRFKFEKTSPEVELSTEGFQMGITRNPVPFEMYFKPI